MGKHGPDHVWSEAPRRLLAGDADLAAVLHLIVGAYAYMDGRIDPPSAMNRMTERDLARQAAEGEVWAIGSPPVASLVLAQRQNSLSVAALAVATGARGRGLARRLVDLADRRARDLGLPWLELKTRVELIDNHAAFTALGFRMTGEQTHPGFSEATRLIFRRPVSPSPPEPPRRPDPR